MRSRGYNDALATGSVAAAGTLGILIPPSVIMVIYALVAEESVPALFAAGMIPGILLAVLFVATVWVIARIRPDWTPVSPPVRWGQRIRATAKMWKLVVLFGFAVGGIYSGSFSPTEAAGIASFVAIVIAAAGRQLRLRDLFGAIGESLRTTAMLMFVITGAWIFAYFVVQTRLPQALVDFIDASHLAAGSVIVIIIAFYVFLGCILDSVAIVLVTVPVFLPVVTALGFDPVWYGILMVVVVEIGLITPPVGLNVFVIRAQIPDVPLSTIFRGIVPFLIADGVLVVLLLAFPELALWLPHALYGK
jgi:tripartite ATP-independent transporter DctM subunit